MKKGITVENLVKMQLMNSINKGKVNEGRLRTREHSYFDNQTNL